MNMLWPMGEATVREIRDRLAERRPRAYTTIMTIMDRLARKGVVERRKVGRAYRYRPNLTMEDARSQALKQVVENFFNGSGEALLAQLGPFLPAARPDAQTANAPRARAAAAGASAQPVPTVAQTAAPASAPASARTGESREGNESPHGLDVAPIDETLL